MSFESIFTKIKSGKYEPVYFLTGEEPYYIDAITDYMAENVLGEGEKAFNQTIIYGRDTDIKSIITMAKRFPMMSPLQLIIVREAQQLRSLDGIEYYLENPLASTILVFAYKYKKIDQRTKAGKLISDKCVVFVSEKIREDKVAPWIQTYMLSKGFKIDEKASSLLVDFLGNDLTRITNELEKLIMVLPAGSKLINADLIEKNIGISKEYNNFELTRAISQRDILKANRIIQYYEKNQRSNPFVLTISALFFYFTKILMYHGLKDKSKANAARELKINPYFVAEYQRAARFYPLVKTQQVISLLREYDLKGKGNSYAAEGELLKELIYKILH